MNLIKIQENRIFKEILSLKELTEENVKQIFTDQSWIYDLPEIPGIKKAVKEFIKHYKLGRDIYVYADYDVDGMTSGTIMKKFLENICEKSSVYFPERTDGYGLSKVFIEDLSFRYSDKMPLVITVDNGITKVEEANLCKQYKIPLIITDHHLPQDELPNATLLDPHLYEGDHWSKALCGAGVAYFFCREIENQLNLNHKITDRLLYLVAIGTVSDIMKQTIVNQAIVRKGFEQINQRNIPATLIELLKLNSIYNITSEHILWEIAPRLNACSRMGNIKQSLTLFNYNKDPLDEILKIDTLNKERKALTKEYEEKILQTVINNGAIAVSILDTIPIGIVGILAGKLQDHTGLPSFVGTIHDGVYHGSARSNYISLKYLLEGNASVIGFGGHASACGFNIDATQLDLFFEETLNRITKFIEEYGDQSQEQVEYNELITITLKDISKETYEAFYSFSYDPVYFTKPILCIKDLEVVAINHSKNNYENVKYSLSDGVLQKDIWGWNTNRFEVKRGDFVTIYGDIVEDFMKPGRHTLNIKYIERKVV